MPFPLKKFINWLTKSNDEKQIDQDGNELTVIEPRVRGVDVEDYVVCENKDKNAIDDQSNFKSSPPKIGSAEYVPFDAFTKVS